MRRPSNRTASSTSRSFARDPSPRRARPRPGRLRRRRVRLLRRASRLASRPRSPRPRARPADLRLVVRLVAPRARDLAEPVLQPRDLRARRRQPRLDDVCPGARASVHAADGARRPGGLVQRRGDAGAGRRGVHGLSPLPAPHTVLVGRPRRGLPLRLLELHARPGAGPHAHDGGVPPAVDRARGRPLSAGRDRRPRRRVAARRSLRPPVLAVHRDPAHRRPRPRGESSCSRISSSRRRGLASARGRGRSSRRSGSRSSSPRRSSGTP